VSSVSQVEAIQEQVQTEFQQYLSESVPDHADRLTRLLLKLPPLNALQASVMEELFFAGLIGNVQIDSIIPYILRMETAEYNSQLSSSCMTLPTVTSALNSQAGEMSGLTNDSSSLLGSHVDASTAASYLVTQAAVSSEDINS